MKLGLVHNRSGIYSVIRNAVHLFGAQSVTLSMRAFYVIFVARQLGPDLFGLIVYGQAWYLSFLSFASFATGIILSREIGTSRFSAKKTVNETFSLRFRTTLVAGFLCLCIGVILNPNIENQILLAVFSVALLGRSTAYWVQEVFVAREQAKHTLVQEVIFRPIEIVALILVLFSGGGAISIAIVHASVWILQGVYGLIYLYRYLGLVPLLLPVNKVITLIISAIPLVIAQATYAWLLQMPLVLSRHLNTVGDAGGHFGLAMQCVVLSGTLPSVIGRAALPALARASNRNDGKDLQFVSVLSGIYLLAGTALGFLMLPIAAPIIRMVFGERYLPAAELLPLAVAISAPFAAGSACYQTLLARRKNWSIALVGVLAILVLYLSFGFLIHTYGLKGGVGSVLLSVYSWMIIGMMLLARTSGLRLCFTLGIPLVFILISIAIYRLICFWGGSSFASISSFIFLLCGLYIMVKNYKIRLNI